MNALTLDQFKQVLPAKMKKSVNQELLDRINSTLEHPETLAILRENMLSYTHVIQDGRFKLDSYVNAVKYCSFKFMGDTNRKAYIRTFPDKYTQFMADGVSEKDIASYYTAYNKSKLVTMIMEQALVPTHILNNHLYQDALNVQADLMMTATSEKVRCDAANSLLVNLKPPENKKTEINLGIEQSSVIEDYQQAMVLMVRKQKELIEAGGDLLSITNASIKRVEQTKEDNTINITPAKLIPRPINTDTSPLNLTP
jgi:hypothetical protein